MLFQQTSSGFVFQPQQSTSADAEIVGIKNSNSPLPLIAYQQCSSSSRPLITYQPCGQDDDIAPTEIIASSVDDNESDIQNELSSNDPRQKERREKARLFMEKIMNEKLSSKKREKSSRNNGSQTHSSNALDSQRSNDLQSPIVIPTEAISQLIDKKVF
jgi:hypothetical protein